jgi:hypothetical protein
LPIQGLFADLMRTRSPTVNAQRLLLLLLLLPPLEGVWPFKDDMRVVAILLDDLDSGTIKKYGNFEQVCVLVPFVFHRQSWEIRDASDSRGVVRSFRVNSQSKGVDTARPHT